MTQVNGNHVLLSTLLMFGVGLFPSHGRAENIISLDPNNTFVDVEVKPDEDYLITVTDLTEADAFAIIQAHGFNGNVTLSYNRTLTRGYYATGANIGLVLYPDEGGRGWSGDTIVYLRNSNNSQPIHVLLGLQVYDSNAPIPGACNMEQSIQIAPFLPTYSSFWILTVEYAPGSWPRNVNAPKCSNNSPLQYDIYHFYLTGNVGDRDALFADIRNMSSVKSIERHGRKVNFLGQPQNSIEFANYVGTGRIVAIIARGLTSSAAYVPTVSHGCLDPADGESCSMFDSVLGKLCGALLLFFGVFFVFLGHRFFKSQVFFIGFCVAATVGFVLLILLASPSETVITWSVVGVGLLGGLVLLGIWGMFGVPFLPVFIGTLILGTLLASILMYTPFADLALLRDDLTFWLMFAVVVLLSPLLLTSFPVLASIVVTSLVGGYFFIFALDEFLGSNLKFIILNFVKRATLSDFSSAIIDPPFQSADVALTVVWALLALGGVAFQLRREKDVTRAPFPPPPSWPTWLNYRTLAQRLGRGRDRIPGPSTETTPLLS